MRKLTAWFVCGLIWMGLGALVSGTSSAHPTAWGTHEYMGWDAAWRIGLAFGAAWLGGTVVILLVAGLISWAADS